jgi:hypothetical protein
MQWCFQDIFCGACGFSNARGSFAESPEGQVADGTSVRVAVVGDCDAAKAAFISAVVARGALKLDEFERGERREYQQMRYDDAVHSRRRRNPTTRPSGAP